MNEFWDFSIQDEYEDYPEIFRNMDHEMEPQLDINTELQDFHLEDIPTKPLMKMSPNVSPARNAFERPNYTSNGIGSQIFKWDTLRSRRLYNAMFTKPSLATTETNFNFNFSNLVKAPSIERDQDDDFLQAFRQDCDLKYSALNSKRSYLSQKGDSRQNSFVKIPALETLMRYHQDDFGDSIEPWELSDKNVKMSESKCASTKLPISESQKSEIEPQTEKPDDLKIKIPKCSYLENLKNISFKYTPKPVSGEKKNENQVERRSSDEPSSKSTVSGCEYKISSGAEINDFNFTASYVKELHKDVVKAHKNAASLKTLSQNETNSTEDNYMVGPLTKKEREQKVKKYLEKKKRRQWMKKVNYQSRKKVADTRPRYKGRFVSFEQAEELVDEFKKDLKQKLIKDRVFITEIFSRKTRALRKIIYPSEEVMQRYSSKDLF